MKVAVVGNGNVGLATFRELQNITEIEEIVLVGRNVEKVKAEVEDYLDASMLRVRPCPKMTAGGYEKTAGADIIIFAAGVGTKPGITRLDLIDNNLKVVDSVFEEINKYNRDSIVLVLSNPIDIITYEIVKITGRPRSKVFGTGTLLDTGRCISYLSKLLDISTKSINMYVIGEHGDSSVVVLSSFRILGMTLEEYLSGDIGMDIQVKKSIIEDSVRKKAANLVKLKGFTAYGVAAAAGRIVCAIAHDENEVLPVTVVLEGEYGVNDLAISVPCVVGRDGISNIQVLQSTDEERKMFEDSVRIPRKVKEDSNI